MKSKLLIATVCLSFLSLKLFSQDFRSFNQKNYLSDHINLKEEIRIYKEYDNKISLLRIFQDDKSNWIAEYFQENDDKTFTKEIITPKKDFDYVLKSLERYYVYKVPSMSEISWKLGNRSAVHKNTDPRIKSKYNYTASITVIKGKKENYFILAKRMNLENSFSFYNPYQYYKHNSEIDELGYYCKILDIITKQFKIWKS